MDVFWSTAIGSGIAFLLGVLTQSILAPYIGKSLDEYMGKRRSCTFELAELLTRIDFISKNVIKSHVADQFSMSDFSLSVADSEILELNKFIHKSTSSWFPYLSKNNKAVLNRYLVRTQKAYDDAKLDWDAVDQNDPGKIDKFTIQTVNILGSIASEEFDSLRLKFLI